MDRRVVCCFIFFFFLGLLLCSGLGVADNVLVDSVDREGLDRKAKHISLSTSFHRKLSRVDTKLPTTARDVTTPLTTVPMINPLNPTSTTTPITNPTTSPLTPTITNPTTSPLTPTITNPVTSPSVPSPASSGGSWCIAVQSASPTALQVAIDYACGYGGADCSAIQQGGSCYSPNTPRDHASYAFNSYYQKNPALTSCNFGGTAVVTNVDPSSGGCQYPSTSTSSSVLNTTNPTGATVYGSQPAGSSNSASSLSHYSPSLFISACLLTPFLAVTL